MIGTSWLGGIARLSNTRLASFFPNIPHNVDYFLQPFLKLFISLHTFLDHGTPPQFEPPIIAYWWWLKVHANPLFKCLPDRCRIRAFTQHVDDRLRLGATKLANWICLATMLQYSIGSPKFILYGQPAEEFGFVFLLCLPQLGPREVSNASKKLDSIS
jgi:hypothetical protein